MPETTAPAVVRQIEDLVAFMQDGQPIDPEQLVLLCESLRADPDQIPTEHAQTVIDQINTLAEYASEQRDLLGDELRKMGDGRRAMRGYSALRSASTNQRLFKQA